MSIMAKDTGGGGDFTPVPEGTHLAVCNMVVDLGHQNTTYMGETTIKHQCYIRWELPHERLQWEQEGQSREGPMVIGKTYTLSLNEKANLRKDLEAWRGKAFTPEELESGFDLSVLLGVPCQVTVTHKHKDGKTYSNVAGLAGWPKGMDKIAPESGVLQFSDDTPGDREKLPKWIQEKLLARVDPADQGAPPPQAEHDYYGGEPAADDLDDTIPF